MSKLFASIMSAILLFQVPSSAEKVGKRTSSKKMSPQQSASTEEDSSAERMPAAMGKELKEAMAMAKAGRYQEASMRFFQLSMSPKYVAQRMQIRYLLGLMLYQLKLYQMSAFQFISVIRDGNNKYVSPALEKLSLAANELGDDTLLNYAISRVKTDSFPAAHKDILFYRIGEYQIRNAQYAEAIRSLTQVESASPLYDKALYSKALAFAQLNDVDNSVETFDLLLDRKRTAPVTDTTRVAALMGRARALYQKKSWDDSIQAYREVPRDTAMWHDTIFESSWAMLRSGRFRSALSNFQSLHSPYYEESYLPESLLLRAIVYLYICQYDEMNKVLDLFTKIYRPVYGSVSSYLKSPRNPTQYFSDVVLALQAAEQDGFDPAKSKFAIPYLVTQKISTEGDFQRSYEYIKKLVQERNRTKKLAGTWRSSGLGKYALQTLERRIAKAKAKAGRQIRAHMIEIKTELIDLYEQEGFIRFEMINSKKELLKKRVAGKELPKDEAIDADTSRDYYIQNGYEYWPFRGEYWLDELGNYHYLGTQTCE